MCKAETETMKDESSKSIDDLPPPKNIWQAMVDDIVDTKEALVEDMTGNKKKRRSFLSMLLTDPSQPQSPPLQEADGEHEEEIKTESQEDEEEEHAAPPSKKNFWQNMMDDMTQARTVIAQDTTRRKSLLDAFLDQRRERLGEEEKALEDETCEEHESEQGQVEDDGDQEEQACPTLVKEEGVADEAKRNVLEEIVHDFTEGDQKILRALGRTALVNLVVAGTAFTGGALTSVAGFATGGAITAKRLGDGLAENNPKEVTKSLAVYGCATTASITGQAVAGALMITVAGATIPAAAAVAFGVGCASGISAGALSEWGVDSAWKDWGSWLEKNQSKALLQASCQKAGASSAGEQQLTWTDVPLQMLCGPQEEVVKQRLGLQQETPKFHRSETEDTTETTESESSESSETYTESEDLMAECE